MNDMTPLTSFGLLALGFTTRTLFNIGLSWYRAHRSARTSEIETGMPLWLDVLETPLSSSDIADAVSQLYDLPHFQMLPDASFLDYRTGANVSWQSYRYLDEVYDHLVLQYGAHPPRILADAEALRHYINYQVKVAKLLNPPPVPVLGQRRALYVGEALI